MTSQNFPGYPSYFHPRIDIGNGTVTQAIPFTSAELTANPYKKSPSICSTPDCSTPIPANNFFKSNFYVYGAILSGSPNGSRGLKYDNLTTTTIPHLTDCNDSEYIGQCGPGCTEYRCNALPLGGWDQNDICYPNKNKGSLVWDNVLISNSDYCTGCTTAGTEKKGKTVISCPGEVISVIGRDGNTCGTGQSTAPFFCSKNKTLSYPLITPKTATLNKNTQPSDSMWVSGDGTCVSTVGDSCHNINCEITWTPEYSIKCGDLKTQNIFGDNFPSSCTLGSSGVGKCYQPQTNSSTGPDYSGDTCLLQPSTKGAPENWSPKYVDDTTPIPKPLPTADNSGAIQCAYGAPVGMFQLLLTGTKHDLWMKNFNWTSKENPGQVASFINSIVKGGKS